MIDLTWKDSIEEVNIEEWEALFPKSKTFWSYEFQNIVEKAKLPNIEYRYLLLTEGERKIGILPCFIYEVPLEILASAAFKKVTNGVRKLYDNFLKVKIFVVGTPIATCTTFIGLSDAITTSSNTMQKVIHEIRKKSVVEHCKLAMIKEIPESELSHFQIWFDEKFLKVNSLPNTIIPLQKHFQPFPSALRKRYRKRYKSSVNVFHNSGYRWTKTYHFGEYAAKLEALYLQVLQKSKHQFERLNEDFFRLLGESESNRIYALLCWDEEDNLICFEIVLEDENILIPLYLGLDYTKKDKGKVYFNCINKVIQEAESLGKDWIFLGQTSYLAKAYVGAFCEHLYLGVYSESRILRFLLNKFSSTIFPSVDFPLINTYTEEKSAQLQTMIKNKEWIPKM